MVHRSTEATIRRRNVDRDVAITTRVTPQRLRPEAIHVSYAMSCWFRGHFVPHLVAQTVRGPVIVLVLRHERSRAGEQVQHFEEDGFRGVIVPAPQGVLAVLGRDAPVVEAAEQVLLALDYASGTN